MIFVVSTSAAIIMQNDDTLGIGRDDARVRGTIGVHKGGGSCVDCKYS
jgi:hypothetical protein